MWKGYTNPTEKWQVFMHKNSIKLVTYTQLIHMDVCPKMHVHKPLPNIQVLNP